jgi:mRNA interferase HigB
VRIISRKRLADFWAKHPDAETTLRRWYSLAKNSDWKSPADVVQTFGPKAVDRVKVRSGSSVTVFDVGGNKYRLVAAIHFDAGRVFVLRVLTHRGYDQEAWKDGL